VEKFATGQIRENQKFEMVGVDVYLYLERIVDGGDIRR
jgi:hypothetical protein